MCVYQYPCEKLLDFFRLNPIIDQFQEPKSLERRYESLAELFPLRTCPLGEEREIQRWNVCSNFHLDERLLPKKGYATGKRARDYLMIF